MFRYTLLYVLVLGNALNASAEVRRETYHIGGLSYTLPATERDHASCARKSFICDESNATTFRDGLSEQHGRHIQIEQWNEIEDSLLHRLGTAEANFQRPSLKIEGKGYTVRFRRKRVIVTWTF